MVGLTACGEQLDRSCGRPAGRVPAVHEAAQRPGRQPDPLVQQGEEYHINWQTDAAWAGSCRRVTLRLSAATDAVAYFRFF